MNICAPRYIFKRFIFICMCMSVVCMCMCATCMPGAHRGQEKTSDALELKLQML